MPPQQDPLRRASSRSYAMLTTPAGGITPCSSDSTSAYLRELYQWPGIRDTVKIDHIKAGYYTNPAINPTLIVPKGPALDFDRPHDRDRLPGKGIWQRG